MRDIWERIEAIIAENGFVVDRPAGTAHPRYGRMIYPLDYGYVPDTISPDGNCMDVWVGKGAKGITAVGVTVDSMKKDSEIKIFINCSKDEIETVRNFTDSEYMSILVFERSDSA